MTKKMQKVCKVCNYDKKYDKTDTCVIETLTCIWLIVLNKNEGFINTIQIATKFKCFKIR